MKKVNLGLIVLVSFSLFLIVYLNSIAAQDFEILSVDESINSQIEEKGTTNVIVYLRDNLRSSDSLNLDKVRRNSKENIKRVIDSIKSEDFELIYEYDNFNGFAAKVDQESIESLQRNPMVREIHPETILSVQMQESMPLINATLAWNYPITPTSNLTGFGQTVCVIDSGIDYTNPLLGGTLGAKVIGGYDFVNGDSDPMDDNGHGTHMAGIIAAKGLNPQNNLSVRGVAPDAFLIAEKVCDSSGWCTSTNMLAGMNHCFTIIHPRKLTAISMSLGDLQSHTQATCPTWMNQAINTSVNNGVPVVASSGNQGFKNGISYPACAPDVISVGVTYDANVPLGGMNWFYSNGSLLCTDNSTLAQTDKVACASNSGYDLDLMAPGARITSTRSSIGSGTSSSCGGGGVGLTSTCSGTSQAAAHVSGAIALIKQKYRNHLHDANPLQGRLGVMKIESILKRPFVQVTDPGNSLNFTRLSVQGLLY